MTNQKAMFKDAALSECGQFRFALWRKWDEAKPTLMFIMLNPSTADDKVDDPTIRKCIGFAERHGFGSIEVRNLFAFRATDPKELKAYGYQVGEANHGALAAAASMVCDGGGKVVCAWGANARDRYIAHQAAAVKQLLRDMGVPLHLLDVTLDGIPCHPLMLSYEIDDGRGGKMLRPLQEWMA